MSTRLVLCLALVAALLSSAPLSVAVFRANIVKSPTVVTTKTTVTSTRPLDGKVDLVFGSIYQTEDVLKIKVKISEAKCFFGTPSKFSGSGTEEDPYTWECLGLNGGRNERGWAVYDPLSSILPK